MHIRDQQIRQALLEHLRRRGTPPRKVVEELHIHNSNAIADVVAFYKEPHCYEIKGETDSVRRLIRQSSYYDIVFPRLTAVVTKNHLLWSLNNLPSYWGIITVEKDNNRIKLKYARNAKNNPKFIKEKALLMLWKAELIDIAKKSDIKVKSAHTREDIASLISGLLKKNDALQSIQSAIIKRESNIPCDIGNV